MHWLHTLSRKLRRQIRERVQCDPTRRRRLLLEGLEARHLLTTVAIQADDNQAAEPGGMSPADPGTFIITRSSEDLQSNLQVMFSVDTTPSNSVGSGDFTLSPPAAGSFNSYYVWFSQGQTSVTVTLNPSFDGSTEPTEVASFKITSGTGYTFNSGERANIMIADNSGGGGGTPVVSIVASDSSASEAGSNNGTFTVSRTGSTSQPLTVTFSVAGTASQGNDYPSLGTTVTIQAGQSSAPIIVDPTDDSTPEPSETVVLTLQDGGNYDLGSPQSATVTIADNGQPALSINDVAGPESGTRVFTVTLSAAVSQTVTVQYATANNTATTSNNDYAQASGTLTFSAGQTTKTITVNVTPDSTDEFDETFFVNLSNASGATIDDPQGIGTIQNDDDPAISISDATITEGGALSFTVSLNRATNEAVTVQYATANESAVAGFDYTATSGTLTFPAGGGLQQNVSVNTTPDTLDEYNETLSIHLSSANNATIADDSATGTIDDNDPLPVLSIGDVTVNEGSGTATLTVTLSPASGKYVALNYATANGSAVAGSDYTAASGTITFDPGQTTKQIVIAITPDALDEPNEVLYVNLSNPSEATLTDDQGTLSITDDDPLPSLGISDGALLEADGNMAFTVTLSAASGRPVSVHYTTSDGSAESPADYTATSAAVSIPAGQTSVQVLVPIKEDAVDEADEAFTVTLHDPVDAAIGDGSGTGVIDDDEGPAVSIADAIAAEAAGTVTLTVSLAASSLQEITVEWATVSGTATAPGDYTTSSGTITFAPLETSKNISIPVINDSIDEQDEIFFVNLSDPTDAVLGDSQAAVTIGDDDPLPSVSISDGMLVESDGNMAFAITLLSVSGRDVTVQYATADGSAVAPDDYTATASGVTIPAGQLSATVYVPIKEDAIDELDESFTVTLQSATHATIADNSATGVIDDDDGPVISITGPAAIVPEASGGLAVFTVTLSAPSPQTVLVNYATRSGSATAGSDFTATSGTLAFAPNETTKTVEVFILTDAIDEIDEPFYVDLSSPVDGTLGAATASATIDDDDGPALSVADASASESAGVMTFTITLAAASPQEITVQ